MILIDKKEIVLRAVLLGFLIVVLVDSYTLFNPSYFFNSFAEKLRFIHILFSSILFSCFIYFHQKWYSVIYGIILFSFLFSFDSPVSYIIVLLLVWRIFEFIHKKENIFINSKIIAGKKFSAFKTVIYYLQLVVITSALFFIIHLIELVWWIDNLKWWEVWYSFSILFTDILFDIKEVMMSLQPLVFFISIITFFGYSYWNIRYSWIFKSNWKWFLILYILHAIYWLLYILSDFISKI